MCLVSQFAGGVSGNLAQVGLYGVGDGNVPSFVFDLLEDRGVLDNRVVGVLQFVVQVRTLLAHGPIYGVHGESLLAGSRRILVQGSCTRGQRCQTNVRPGSCW